MVSQEKGCFFMARASGFLSGVSLVKKTMMVVALSLIVIMGSAIWFQVRAVTQNRTEELKARLQLVSQIQAAALAAPVWNMETATIDAMLKGLQADADFSSVAVVDQAGALQQKLGEEKADVTSTAAPIVYDNQTIGTLKLVYSNERLKKEVHELTLQYAGFGLALLLATLLALYGALQMILSPLSRLRTSMLTLAEGNADTIIPALDRQDEIGAMAKAVDVFKQNKIRGDVLMAERIQKAADEKAHALETAKPSRYLFVMLRFRSAHFRVRSSNLARTRRK